METIDFSATLVRDTDGAQTNVRTEEGRDVIVLYSQCRKLWKDKVISGTWSWHGVIYAKKHTNQVVIILCEEDVTKLSR